MEPGEIKQLVFQNLDNAKENGYWDDPTGYAPDGRKALMRDWKNEEIAEDLCNYAGDLDQLSPETLVPFVKEWREKNAD